jgi:hypothetical protein
LRPKGDSKLLDSLSDIARAQRLIWLQLDKN